MYNYLLYEFYPQINRGRRGRVLMVISSLKLSVRILLMERCTQYVIKIVSNLRQLGGFRRVLRFPPPI